MKQVFLTFNGEAEFRSLVPSVFNADGTLVTAGTNYNVDVIGVIYNDDAEYSEDGELTKAPSEAAGYHVNMLVDGDFEASLPSEKIVTPSSPSRVFQGY